MARYVERNGLRAKLAKSAAAWPWSSLAQRARPQVRVITIIEGLAIKIIEGNSARPAEIRPSTGSSSLNPPVFRRLERLGDSTKYRWPLLLSRRWSCGLGSCVPRLSADGGAGPGTSAVTDGWVGVAVAVVGTCRWTTVPVPSLYKAGKGDKSKY